MNKIINILLSILLIFAVSGCSKDENGNLPDDMKDAALAYLQLEATSDELVDLNNVDDFNLDYTVNTLFEPAFQKLTLVVVYNSDYANQYVLVDNITAVPVTGTITMANLVNAIPALNTSADVAEGDNFHFFVNATLEDGTFLPQFMALGSDPTKATQLVSPNLALALNEIKGVAQFDLKIPVPCAFNLSDYIGTLNCIEDWGGGETYEYTVDVAEDAEYTGDKIGIVITGIFDGAGISVTKMEINPKNLKLVMDEEQMVIEDITDIGYPAAYGSLFMEPIVGGIVNTCEMQLEFTVSSWCVSIGCFGGSPQYTLWKDAGGIMEPNNLQSKIPVNKLNKKVN